MVCLRNICINTLHKGDSIFTYNNNNINNNNNNNQPSKREREKEKKEIVQVKIWEMLCFINIRYVTWHLLKNVFDRNKFDAKTFACIDMYVLDIEKLCKCVFFFSDLS
jgi:hypothetical protein